MKPHLKRLDTNSGISLDKLCESQPENFGFWINASIGTDETEGADDFQIFVCNREWLEDESRPSGLRVEKYLLIEGSCDSVKLASSLNAFLAECIGASWTDVVAKISKIGAWEFEGYQP